MLFKDHYHKQLNKEIMECESCKLKDNPGPVLGYGGENADVMFIGDVAKRTDLTHGIPFTGIAKERFAEVIKTLGFKKGEYYLTYLIKHTIDDTVKPDTMTHKPCLEILLKEIELINPRVICTMGYYATRFIMHAYDLEEQGKSMKELHGNGYIIPEKTFRSSRYRKKEMDKRPKRYLIPTWSPAVENEQMNEEMMTDIMTIKSVQNLSILLY